MLINYGGADILTAVVQSVGKLQNFVLPVSLLWFFVYFILYMSVAYTVCGLVVWMILSVIRNRNLAIIVCVLVYGAEYFLYSFIPKGLTISIFRYTNLWFLLEPGELYQVVRECVAVFFACAEYSGYHVPAVRHKETKKSV